MNTKSKKLKITNHQALRDSLSTKMEVLGIQLVVTGL